MVVSNDSSAQVATQVATNTGTSGGSAGNNPTTGGAGPIASSTPVVAPRGERLALQHMLQGWQELIPSGSTLLSSAGSLTQAAVLAQLQEYLGVYTDLDTHAMGLKQVRAKAESQLPEVRTYVAALKAAVVSYFGARSPQLAKFGLKPKKTPATPTSTQLAVRAAKVQATRKLRGTLGSKQKAGIKAGPMQVSVGPVAVKPEVTAAAPAVTSPTPVVQTPVAAASTAPTNAAVGEASPAAGK